MDGLLPTVAALGLMAAVVLLFRSYVRRPAHVPRLDPPGVRTIVTFSGSGPELFAEDSPDSPLVGVRLFRWLCDGLAGEGVLIDHRGTIQNAHRAQCAVGRERFSLVLEWIDRAWMASVEWVPATAAEQRHLDLTQQVFAPPDSPALRHFLTVLDRCLKGRPQLSNVRWHRKERWAVEDLSDASQTPLV